jgi:orotate phosphoribosyltransferase
VADSADCEGGRPARRNYQVSADAVTDRPRPGRPRPVKSAVVTADPAADRAALLTFIKRLAIVRGDVILSSGQHADWYIDLRRVLLDGEAAPLAGRVMLDVTAGLSYDAVGGLTLGADPVATAMLHAAAAGGRKLDAFVVRKSEKAHGLQRRIEGPDVAGRRVLAVEDTSTTGGSVLTAVDALEDAGAEVVGVAVVVERGARLRIAERGLDYLAAFELEDLGLA